MIVTPLIKIIQEGFILNQQDLFLAIKENNKRKSSCLGHDFSIELKDASFSHSYKYQCEKCGALCNYQYKEAYELGLRHGRGKTNE